MRNLLRTLMLGLGLTLVLGSGAQAADLKTGDEAPAFSMTGSDGKTYKLSDFKDKQTVVLAWYPKAFTGGCTAECKALRESGKALREYNIAYFTASCDTVEKNTDFAKSLDLDYPILSDPDKKIAEEYGVVHEGRAVPERWTFFIGKDGKLLHVEKQVKAGDHARQILDKLAELKVEKAKKAE